MRHGVLLLFAVSCGLWAWQNETQPARDFSTPASRLIGRWKSADLSVASSECEFFGPVDSASKTGVFEAESTGPKNSHSLEATDKSALFHLPMRRDAGVEKSRAGCVSFCQAHKPHDTANSRRTP